MIYPDIDYEVWSKRYGIGTDSRACKNCGVEQIPSIPFANKEWRGLMAPVHDPCGKRYQLKRIVLADPKERAEWKAFVQNELPAYLGG